MTKGQTAIQAIFEKTRGELGRRVVRLEEAVEAMSAGTLDEDMRASAERDAHKLAGSLGMFGLWHGSELAREFEEALSPADGFVAFRAPRLAELAVSLRAQLEVPGAAPGSAGAEESPGTGGPVLLLLSHDEKLVEDLAGEAFGKNLRLRSATSCRGANLSVESEPPDAALLDLGFGVNDDDCLALLEDLAGRTPTIPVLILTGSEALLDRVEVARRGGRGFVQRTRPASQVIEAVCEQIERARPKVAKILAVDDDSTISAALEALLGPHGLDVATLNDPLRFWDELEATAPDLLLLDFDMPGLSGIDLCKAVRADVRFGQIPIVFLTVRTDPESVQRIFEAGADDYVSKPIVEAELVTRILNRLDRVRLHRDLAAKDSLTGVASRRASTAAIEDRLAMGDRFGQPVSIALIDLDNFKHFNDTLGHAAGDMALQCFGEMLAETFRGEDVIGRWGGEEFVVGMYGMARDDGLQRITEVLAQFRQEQFTGRDGRTSALSFSAGVAEYSRDGEDLHQLYRAADDALYRAKRSGRDQVLQSDPDQGPSTEVSVATAPVP